MRAGDHIEYTWDQVLDKLGLSQNFRQRSTGVLIGTCLVHKEKTASLHLWPESRNFRCHGCDWEGTLLDFVKELREYDFSYQEDKEDFRKFFFIIQHSGEHQR